MANLRRLIIACNVFFTITNSSQALGFLCLISFLCLFMLIFIFFFWVYCYASVGHICVSEDGDLPFEFHLEALGWSGFHIRGLCNSLYTTCQNGSTGLC